MKNYHLVGSCHIDLAWCADEEEYFCYLENMTVVMLDMLDRYPDFTYLIEQAYHYRSLKKRRPDLFERVRREVEKGRVEVIGGMISTQETNVPCPESMVRNRLMGANWFKQNMNADVPTGWLMDTFGSHAQIPQIMKSLGVKQMLANRLGGDKTIDMFWSEGLDGTKLLYAGQDVMSLNLPVGKGRRFYQDFAVNGANIDRLINAALQSDSEGPIFVSINIEDEWVPTRRSVAALERMRTELKKTGSGDARFSLPRDFFKELYENTPELPVENGDLNPEFTGTFSLRSDLRTINRASEAALLDAEKWCALVDSPDSAKVHDAWWDMCFVYFHDIFTGSHPQVVFDDATGQLKRIAEMSKNAVADAVGAVMGEALQGDILAVNSLEYDRRDWVWINADGNKSYSVTRDGRELPILRKAESLGFLAEIPAMSTVKYRVEALEEPFSIAPEAVPSATLENDALLLTVDARDGVTLLDRRMGKKILDEAKDLLLIQNDLGSYQIEEPEGAELYAWTNEVAVSRNPQAGTVTARGAFRRPNGELDASWEIEFSLATDETVGMKVNVDWQAVEKRLHLELNTEIEGAGEGLYEVPFGVVSRRSYVSGINKKGEWPARRFAAIENGKLGAALINDGTPGVEIHSNVLYTTLLRAPIKTCGGMRFGDSCLQRGLHTFRFAIAPYEGDWRQGGVLRQAQRFNQPLRAFAAPNAKETSSMARLEGEGVELSAIKKPESGEKALVIRVFEAYGKEASARLYVKGALRAWKTDMAETREAELGVSNGWVDLTLKPHEIVTIIVERE